MKFPRRRLPLGLLLTKPQKPIIILSMENGNKAALGADGIKRIKRGQLAGLCALIFCAAVLAAFAALYTVASLKELGTLKVVSLSVFPVLLAAGIAVAAYCNIVYDKSEQRMLADYVRAVFLENYALMHAERDSLSYYITVEKTSIEIKVNGYSEKIRFDFSAYGRLSAGRKLSCLTQIENRLIKTFCRLYERGSDYKSVSFTESEGTRKKSCKPVVIIESGVPDAKAYKAYLKL